MNAPLSRHLALFGALVPPPQFSEAIAEAVPTVTMTVDELDERITSARNRSVADLESVHERRMQDASAAHATALSDALATARDEWASNESKVLCDTIAGALCELRSLLAGKVAAALVPLVEASLLSRAAAQMSSAIDSLLADPGHAVLTIRGPADLIAAIAARRGNQDGIELLVAEAGEAKMSANGALIETRLTAAVAALDEAMKEA